MIEVQECETDRLSYFHTQHRFLHYGEFVSVEEFLEYRAWAKERGLPVFILGNGSNTFFRRRKVRSLVLKNNLATWMKPLDDRRIDASSSLNLTVILKHCQKNSLDSFYYLASVPATVGGAIAMNAGRGRKYNKSIFDYVESVTFVDDDKLVTLPEDEIDREYRHTMFTGIQDRLIVSAVFRFEHTELNDDQIMERIEYSKREQDLSGPNCGSVFRDYHQGILGRLKGFKIGRCTYSPKTINWIVNRSASPWCIRGLILVAKAAHLLIGRRAQLEIIEVS